MVGAFASLVGCVGDTPTTVTDAGGTDSSVDAPTYDATSDATTDSGGDAAGDGGVVAPSCAASGAGLTTCGSGSESCCTSLPVVGGTYDRTYTNTGSGATAQADPATVASFRLDKYEVTVGRFRQFVNAWNNGSGWTPPAGSGKHTHLNGGQGLVNSGTDAGLSYETGWATSDNGNIAPTNANLACDAAYATWTNTATSQEKQPINCVNWSEAAAFCIWDGGFLPSEAEWQYAAAGGSQERQFPWGNTLPGTGNQYAIYDCNYPSPGKCADMSKIAPVGTPTAGAGLWGQLDLAGNVWEWNLDWYAPYVASCTNCADLSMDSRRVYRGGNFNFDSSYLLPPHRNYDTPTNRYMDLGFRCARTP